MNYPPQTPTPRTDAVDGKTPPWEMETQLRNLAHELERELARASRELDEIRLGTVVVLPKSRDHAMAMGAVADNYLETNRD